MKVKVSPASQEGQKRACYGDTRQKLEEVSAPPDAAKRGKSRQTRQQCKGPEAGICQEEGWQEGRLVGAVVIWAAVRMWDPPWGMMGMLQGSEQRRVLAQFHCEGPSDCCLNLCRGQGQNQSREVTAIPSTGWKSAAPSSQVRKVH